MSKVCSQRAHFLLTHGCEDFSGHLRWPPRGRVNFFCASLHWWGLGCESVLSTSLLSSLALPVSADFPTSPWHLVPDLFSMTIHSCLLAPQGDFSQWAFGRNLILKELPFTNPTPNKKIQVFCCRKRVSNLVPSNGQRGHPSPSHHIL